MSSLTQFFSAGQNAGGTSPMGGVVMLSGSVGQSLIVNGTETYIQTGTTIYDPDPSILSAVSATGFGFVVPGSATQIGAYSTDLAAIATDGSRYIRICNQQKTVNASSLLVSEDGVSWTISAGLINALPLASPVYFGSKFYILASSPNPSTGTAAGPALYSSADGMSWDLEQIFPYVTNLPAFASLSIANSKMFVAVGGNNSNTEVLYVSSDGSMFTPCAGITATSYNVAWQVFHNGSVYVWGGCSGAGAGGQVYYSSDGMTWSTASVGNATTMRYFTMMNNVFFSISQSSVYTSSNGSTWTSQTGVSGINGSTMVAAYGGTTYVISDGSGNFATSTNGTTWSVTGSGPTGISSIVYGGSTFVAINSTNAYTSSNGSSWSTQTLPYTGTASSSITPNTTTRLAYLNSKFWFLDSYGSITNSSDGITWSRILSTVNVNASTSQGCISVGTKIIYLPSNGGIQTIDPTTDTITRTLDITTVFNGVTFGNGLYVAVGASGTIYTSTDAITWTSRTSGTPSTFNSVGFGNGRFVASGGNPKYSDNGTTWSSCTGTCSNWVSYTNGFWAATNATNTGASTAVTTSSDGITWTARTLTYSGYNIRVLGELMFITGSTTTSTVIANPGYTTNILPTGSTFGYNSSLDMYIATTNTGIYSSAGALQAATAAWSAGQVVTATTAVTSNFLSQQGVTMSSGSICQIPGTSTMIGASTTPISLSVSILGNHFCPVDTLNSGGFVALVNVLGSYMFATQRAVYAVSPQGNVVYFALNALSSGLVKQSAGGSPSIGTTLGSMSYFRRIA